jgi:hypothetical protein
MEKANRRVGVCGDEEKGHDGRRDRHEEMGSWAGAAGGKGWAEGWGRGESLDLGRRDEGTIEKGDQVASAVPPGYEE